MSALLKQLNKTLSAKQKVLAKQLARSMKKPEVNHRILLVRDTLTAGAGRGNTELRHLLGRNMWSTTETIAAHFDDIGGAEFVKGAAGVMFQSIPINDRQLVRLEYENLVKFLGEDTTSKLRLGPRNLQRMADEAADDNAIRAISRTWTLEGELAKCGCRPGTTRILDSRVALNNWIKWVAIAALLVADMLAFTNPTTIPLGVASLALAGRLARRAC